MAQNLRVYLLMGMVAECVGDTKNARVYYQGILYQLNDVLSRWQDNASLCTHAMVCAYEAGEFFDRIHDRGMAYEAFSRCTHCMQALAAIVPESNLAQLLYLKALCALSRILIQSGAHMDGFECLTGAHAVAEDIPAIPGANGLRVTIGTVCVRLSELWLGTAETAKAAALNDQALRLLHKRDAERSLTSLQDYFDAHWQAFRIAIASQETQKALTHGGHAKEAVSRLHGIAPQNAFYPRVLALLPRAAELFAKDPVDWDAMDGLLR